MGKEFFRLLTRQFIGQHLSRSGNLHSYGAEMAGFIAAFDTAQGLLGEAIATTLAHLSRFRFTSRAAETGRTKHF